MALRRMFHKDIVLSDRFIEMPTRCQALYFQLAMNADDEGFVGGAFRIARSIGVRQSDLQILVQKGFIHLFDHGVAYIENWHRQNRVPKHQFKPTIYWRERNFLGIKDVIQFDEEMELQRELENKRNAAAFKTF